MSDRLPPLTALRAFDAAARCMSFADAAAELNVTPSALSFQIKSLEEHLGAPVFLRLNRKIELTEAGRALVPGLRAGFEALQSAWDTAQRSLDKGHLTVTAGPAFMSTWLAPRMSEFVVAHPELELRLTGSLKLLSFERDAIDLAIRFGPLSDAGYFSEVLFEEWATPMMTPELAKTVQTPKDLENHTFVGQDSHEILASVEQWDEWCAVTGVNRPKTTSTYFSTPDSALTYAANGGGVVLGRIALAQPYLDDGRLVAPLKQAVRRGHFYRLICPQGRENEPNIMIFRDWIREEIKSLDAYSQGREFL